ncbi:hypothetical protein [Streptomyces sp. H27-D2]|uniref:hypothetical protein n=1 Tax=Streptomyces sp. H27-D2 TaxID=3046304 RepID=UPI002DB858F0|nr:hypothetical protein [Streptomyces sp. H27-D2]MEC4016872.1 hypothetical protein [Streptomyces sp. H27-D2]
MPTPYGSRGGMAFSADELCVLRRALAIALRPTPLPARPGPDRSEEIQDCLRLAGAVDEAAREGARLRAFLRADLARYRAALPGAAVGYLEQLQDALAAGYTPLQEDLSALRALSALPAGEREAERRTELLRRCEGLAERAVRARLADRTAALDAMTASVPPLAAPVPPMAAHASPLGRVRLHALPGGRCAASPWTRAADEPQPKTTPKTTPKTEPEPNGPQQPESPSRSPVPAPAGQPRTPARPGAAPPAKDPARPVPTPGEVFPRRRPA